MRDAFGGSFMIKLFIVFIFIYVFFIAIALNYAKAFKVKNKVIEYIETHEIVDLSRMTAKSRKEMQNFMDTAIYDELQYSYISGPGFCVENKTTICPYPGIKIEEATKEKTTTEKQRFLLGRKKSIETGTNENIYAKTYIVTVAVPWEASFLNKILELNNQSGDVARGIWTISGETRLIASEE